MHVLPRFIAALAALSAVASATTLPHWHRRIRGVRADNMGHCKLTKAMLPTIHEPNRSSPSKLLNCPIARRRRLTDADKQLAPPKSPHPIRVVLGHGTQNYTCATHTASSVPAAIGAKAWLYDASCLAQNNPERLHRLPAEIVDMKEDKVGGYIARQTSGYSDNAIGSHYFSNPKTPVFDFHHGDYFAGKKLGDVPAPASAAHGKWGTVDWLLLQPVHTGTVEYEAVYRVITSGGKPPADCSGQPRAFQVHYATEYCRFPPLPPSWPCWLTEARVLRVTVLKRPGCESCTWRDLPSSYSF